jgi:hypothetical protein
MTAPVKTIQKNVDPKTIWKNTSMNTDPMIVVMKVPTIKYNQKYDHFPSLRWSSQLFMKRFSVVESIWLLVACFWVLVMDAAL